MRVTVNGAPTDLPDDTGVSQLIEHFGLKVGSVVVEHNGTALLRSEAAIASLADGDRIELVRAVAGG